MNVDITKRICRRIKNKRFNWERFLTPKEFFGVIIGVQPLYCSYGQIGYIIYFPYSSVPNIEYDWEMNKITINNEEYVEC